MTATSNIDRVTMPRELLEAIAVCLAGATSHSILTVAREASDLLKQVNNVLSGRAP